jgi:multiple sugar transport system permease protein
MTTTTERPVRRGAQIPSPPATRRLSASPWRWLLPLSAVLALVFAYPIEEIIRLGFTDASLVSGEPYRYTAGAYRSLIGGTDFRHTLEITFLFVLASCVFQLLLGLATALLVNGAERRGLRGSFVTRTVVMTAWAVPGVIIGIIWSLMYQETDSGILNHALELAGASGHMPFLSDPHLALVSVTVANVWRGTAFSMILCYAGLKTVPEDVYEAARIDGAGGVARLVRITLPLMLPILLTNLVLIVIETFNSFDMVLSLTGGGPGDATEVLALDIYDQIFQQLDLGRGAAMATVLLLINVVMIACYLRLVARQGRST